MPIVYLSRKKLNSISCLGWPLVCVSIMPLDMGQLLSLSLSLPITTCCCCEYKLADRSQVLAGILNFSLLWSVVAVTWEYWPGLPLPGAGFNYDHCQSPPPAPARVSFSEKPWLSFSHNNPPSHYPGPHQSHCTAFLAMMGRFCWPLKCYVSSLPHCTCAVPVSRLRMSQSSVTLVTWLSRASIYLEHSTVTQSAQAGDGAHMDIIHAKC